MVVGSEKDALLQLREGRHPPSRFRVNAPLTLMPEFAQARHTRARERARTRTDMHARLQAFSCAIGSEMNPRVDDKCVLWNDRPYDTRRADLSNRP